MSALLAAVLGVFAGAALVVALAFLPPEGWGWVNRRQAAALANSGSGSGDGSAPPPPGTFRALAVLDELPTATVVLDGSDEVLFANGAAQALGVIRGNRLALSELRDVIRSTRRDGRVRELEVDVAPVELRRRPLAVRARIVPAGGPDVAIIVDDLTEARRVEAVRRDFVANISHELKTPVGAVSLLAEAVVDGADDPETVRHFAERLQHEALRLGRLVQELIDLSRLQGADPLPDPSLISLRHVVQEAIDRARLAAAAKDIALVYDDGDATVLGDETLLVTAVSNLIDNAVAYSPDHTKVAVSVRAATSVDEGEPDVMDGGEPGVVDEGEPGAVEISVTDQGIGIASDDIPRVFERFYRVDPARSRSTGGTGLGLSIVKHIVTNHGGHVSVWSVPGEGSTFTLRLPTPDRAGARASTPVRREADR